MTSPDELKEAAQSVSWWLAPENAQARRELAERRPELEAWLSMVERKVAEKLAQVEKQEANVRA
ncbi:hypothetical protein M1367_03535 [Candidatus Marsarchaeota archaeon]|jgi:flagellar biosynthesis chaperone FliJ|nr:hypothetical protein [Candidatus Marsarchaeota archaeon]